MEGLLRPWVHYVPLDNPAEARARVAWMEAHEEDCLRIVRNANAWMRAIANQTTWDSDVRRVMRHALELPDGLTTRRERTVRSRGDSRECISESSAGGEGRIRSLRVHRARVSGALGC